MATRNSKQTRLTLADGNAKVSTDRNMAAASSSPPPLTDARRHEEVMEGLCDIKNQLETIKCDVSGIQNRVTSLEEAMTDVDSRVDAHEERIAALERGQRDTSNSLTELQNYTRRTSIRIIGVPESSEGPQPIPFAAKFLSEVFGAEIFPKLPKLDDAFRIPVAQRSGDRPRPFIVKFHELRVKDLVVREARRRRGSLKYNGANILVFEDFATNLETLMFMFIYFFFFFASR